MAVSYFNGKYKESLRQQKVSSGNVDKEKNTITRN